jgi:ketosteroid isomerase-like protein
MSTVGKVLVVAQIAFSILLMAFAGGVYSVQTNWKKQYDTASGKLKKAETDLNSVKQKCQKDTDTAVAAQKALKDAADRAQGTADAEKTQLTQMQRVLTQTRTELENVRAEAKIAGDEARARRDEAISMRQINNDLHRTRDEQITLAHDYADKVVNLEQQKKAMSEKHDKLLADYAILQKFIRIKGFDSDPREVAGLAEPAPIVVGVVLNTRKGGRNGAELVEISLGSDAGLAKGHELFVYRSSNGKGKYLGRIRLDYVDYKTSVGVVVQSTKNGQMQVGDDVTTKL